MHSRHITRLRARLALLFAALLGLAGLTAAPALADDPVEARGLKGEYYTQSAPGAFDFHELRATTFDPNLDFDTLEPRLAAATGRSDDVSVRWTGRLVPTASGPHTFSVIGDNGFRLWIGGQLLIDHWVDDWDREQTAQPVELAAGESYDIKVEYFEHYGGSNLHLRWFQPGGTKQAVPQSAFRLPEGYDYDGPVATTVLGTGRTLKLDFAQPLAAPPDALTDHLQAVIGGAKWPLGAAKPDPEDPVSCSSPSPNPSWATGPAPRAVPPTSATTAKAGSPALTATLSARSGAAGPIARRTNCARSGPTRWDRTTPTPSTRGRS